MTLNEDLINYLGILGACGVIVVLVLSRLVFYGGRFMRCFHCGCELDIGGGVCLICGQSLRRYRSFLPVPGVPVEKLHEVHAPTSVGSEKESSPSEIVPPPAGQARSARGIKCHG